MEKYIKIQLYKVSICKGSSFVREIIVAADTIEEVIVLSKEIAGEGYDIGAITKDFRSCYKATTKTVTIEV